MRFPCKDPIQLSGGRCGWAGRADMTSEGKQCIFSKPRSYPMHLSGYRCGWVGNAVMLVEVPGCVFD